MPENRLSVLLRGRIFMAAVTGALFCSLLVAAAPAAIAAVRFPERAAAPQATSRVVIDEVGRRVAIPAQVRRVVTLSPDLTETVYALGLEDRLVGDTNECVTPAAAKYKTHVGEPKNPSLEAIVSLQPDLVLASASINRVETADSLARLGIPVYTSDPHTVRGMLNSVQKIANLLDATAQGKALVAGLQAHLDALDRHLANLPLVHVLFVVWEDPLITIGQNTFIADALRFAGAESVIVSDQNWPQVSMEEVVRLQPDYILFTSSHGDEEPMQLAELRSRPVWRSLDAVELGHVAEVSDEMARPSPGMITAIEDLARQLHPEAFSAQGENEPHEANGQRSRS
jgi:cobalamin transport system substrate-binding protein